MGIRNFGIGLGLSPYKQEKEEEKKDNKPKKEVKEYGGGAKQPDKGWVKALKAGVTVLSHGLASVYGGTAHTPKINWGKREKQKQAIPTSEETLKAVDENASIDNSETKEKSNEMNFASKAEGDEFRAWVNKTYPEEAKKMDLDPSGSHTNSYIKKAWNRFGKEFNETKSPAKMTSPLNKGKRGQRGTATRGKSTATRKRRGGFTKGGKGGRNMGNYNVQTRFRPRATQPIRGGVTTVSSDSGGGKPYSFNEQGDIVINNYIDGGKSKATSTSTSTSTAGGMEWVPAEYGTRTVTGKLPTYKQSWENMPDAEGGGKKNKYGKVFKTYEEYEKAAIEWNKNNRGKGGGSTSRTETYKIKDGYWRPIGGTSSSSTATATAETG